MKLTEYKEKKMKDTEFKKTYEKMKNDLISRQERKMPRYIDADALYESTAEWEASALAKIEELNKTPLEEMDDAQKALWRKWTAILGERTAFKHDVADAPTADVVEVVRCEECAYYDKHIGWKNADGTTNYSCGNFQLFMSPDFFCKWGERREQCQQE